MKKLFIMLCSLMLFGLFIFSGCAGSTDKNQVKPSTAIDLDSASVGDYVAFGHYEQDNNLDNGKEDIEWKVLDKKNGHILLLSRYGLDCQKYNEEQPGVTWETCTLRIWLNSYFLNEAFSETEKSAIPTVTLSNPDNPNFGTEGGNDTQDQVFLLSLQEMQQYFDLSDTWTDYNGNNHDVTGSQYYISGSKDVITSPTAYAKALEAYVSTGLHDAQGFFACFWWLRSPGENSSYAAGVGTDGKVHAGGFVVVGAHDAVRPALWVNLAS